MSELLTPPPPNNYELPEFSGEQVVSEFLNVVSQAEKEIDELTITLNSLIFSGLDNQVNQALYREAKSQLVQFGDRLSTNCYL